LKSSCPSLQQLEPNISFWHSLGFLTFVCLKD